MPSQPVAGIRVGSAAAGIRRRDRDDVVLFELIEGSTVAAVFTRNAFCAAPVVLARRHLSLSRPRYLLVNSGNANAGMGDAGLHAALQCCRHVAALSDCDECEVLPFSTGVIGEPLPVGRMRPAIQAAMDALRPAGWSAAAHAIMTTDTVPKEASRTVQAGVHSLTVTGIAKGAGMIRPNLATMLAFVATDAGLTSEVAAHLLRVAVDRSFNRITVDGDTSTNDACVLIATGQARVPAIASLDCPLGRALQLAVIELCEHLAQSIVRDAEGSTRFIAIEVTDAATVAEASRVAYTIAHSPLVKTAFFAGDPNWGRILAAVGRAGVAGLDIKGVDIWLDDLCVVRRGERTADYCESDGARVMGKAEFAVRVQLSRGAAQHRVWTCDLSYDYVRINAEYRS